MTKLLIAFVLIIIAQCLTYFQLQSQFFWTWAKQHPLLMSIFGFPISILYIFFTKYLAEYFDGQTWPGRLIGFAMGAIVFALLSNLLMGEVLTNKTIVCLFLSLCILVIQFYWK
jgi:hypothetical protein